MKNVQVVIPDLFLPSSLAAQAYDGLRLPALETLLARAREESLPQTTLEAWLCAAFGVEQAAIAPITLRADGVEAGAAYWLRADPAHLHLNRDQLILQADLPLSMGEAAELCASLNAHFADDGLHFAAPHPRRWYLRLSEAPAISTQPVGQVLGKNVHAHLPQGQDALRWHGLVNEIQMLLHEHPVNLAIDARGELPVNSVWLWGGGREAGNLLRPYASVGGDSELAAAFARSAGIAGEGWDAPGEGDALVVWEGPRRALQYGDIDLWRDALRQFESRHAAPLLSALRAGQLGRITLDALQKGAVYRYVLTRNAARKFWLRPKSLARHALV
jgi:hypothetical protein